MPILHRKRVPASRPDNGDGTLVHGISAWGAAHVSPNFLAYVRKMPSGSPIPMPGPNRPDTEIARWRSKYDFTYVDKVRLVVGCDYGTAKIGMKYSLDGTTWFWFDGVNGPYITQSQVYSVPTMFASAWVNLVAGAKGDRIIAPFYRENATTEIIRLGSIELQAF